MKVNTSLKEFISLNSHVINFQIIEFFPKIDLEWKCKAFENLNMMYKDTFLKDFQSNFTIFFSNNAWELTLVLKYPP